MFDSCRKVGKLAQMGAMMQSKVSHEADLRKHPCPDCKMCQNCSDSRCAACHSGGTGAEKRKLSFREQIALYNQLNPFLGSGRTGACSCGSLKPEIEAGRDSD